MILVTTGDDLVTNTAKLVTRRAGKDFSNTVAMTKLTIQCSNDSGSDQVDESRASSTVDKWIFGAFEKRLVLPSSQWCRR